MDLIAQLEAEQVAALGKDIPDFKAGDTIRVGYKVTEGTRSRVQNYEGVCQCARFPLVKAWNVCSHCIQQISKASQSSAVAASVAPSCTTCVHVVVSPRVSPR